MNALPREVESVVLTLCEDLATPISLGVFLRIKYGEFNQLAVMAVDPSSYLSSEDFYHDYVAVSILKKYPELPTTIDRKAVAVESFWASEKACCSANVRLKSLKDGSLEPSDLACLELIARARKVTSFILGPCPDLVKGRFGPGATFGDRGRLTTVPDKMSSQPTLTSGALPFLFQWSGTAWASACANAGKIPTFVRGNRFTTVPKDSTKDRGICIEPSINVFYQLGYGRVIRERLRKIGIYLDRAQEVHKQVARDASIKKHLATIDLSNASDTVSTELVRLLLPSHWYRALDCLRSPTTVIDGKTVHLHKFSSMGNGFTFELETLLFLAISCAALTLCRGLAMEDFIKDFDVRVWDVYVFGDDIIVPSDTFSTVIAALRYLGFTPNDRKTFNHGSFRESCGGDFFNGKDVRPYFIKEVPNEPQRLIAIANGIRRLGRKDHYPSIGDPLYLRSWFRVLDAIPSDIRRLRGPEGLGDLVIHDDRERWSTRWRNSIRYIESYVPIEAKYVSWSHFRPDVVLATALYGTGDGERGILPRDSVSGFKKRWVPFS